MAFFRKWKLSSKHKKLSEEWALANSLKDFSESQDQEDEKNVTTFNLKYLGSTPVDSERSENATAEAIKSVIATAKSSRKKNQRITLNVSPRGIEMLDNLNLLLRVSIYKISYCSADDHVFAFIVSDDNKKNDNKVITSKNEEELACHAFLCPKRRIAHDVTLTVARCFENAYQIWRHSVERKMYQEEIRNRCNSNNKQIENEKQDQNEVNNDLMKDLLIDLTPDLDIRPDLYERDHTEFLQNTWITFEDESRDVMGGRFCTNSREHQLVF